MCDELEPRRMMATHTFSGGSSADTWSVSLINSNTQIQVVETIGANSPSTTTWALADNLYFEGNAGDDQLIVNANGAFTTVSPLHFTGGANDDTVRIDQDLVSGTDTPPVLSSGLTSTSRWASVYDDAEYRSLNLSFDSYIADPIEVYGGNLVVVPVDLTTDAEFLTHPGFTAGWQFNVTQHLSGLPGPTATMLAGSNSVLVAPLSSFSMTSVLDLNDNSLIWNYSGTSKASLLRQYIYNGRNGGSQDGTTGIRSTSASLGLYWDHGIGYAEAQDLLSISGTQTATWNGENVDATTLLATYTWLGDTDLDGDVDATDFEAVRASIAHYATLDSTDRTAWVNWQHGDFDYDGDIDKDDIALMTASYNAIANAWFDDPAHSAHDQTVVATGNATSDLAALNAALDDLKAHSGGTLTIDGVCNLGSAGISVSSADHIRIRGTHFNSTTGLPTDGFEMTAAPSQDGMGMLRFTSSTDILVESLMFDGDNRQVYGIASFSSTRVTLDNCDVSNIFLNTDTHCDAAYSQASTDNHFTNNYVHDAPGIAYSGQWGGASDTGTVIVGNLVRRHTYDVFNGYMHNALIAGNDIDGLHHLNSADDDEEDVVVGGGMALSGTKVHDANNNNAIVEQYSENCVVFDNTLVNSFGGGFQCDAWVEGTIYNVTVFRNSITHCQVVGLLTHSATDSYFIDNDFTHNGRGADINGAHNVTIQGNDFSYSAGDGILVESEDLWADPDRDPPFYMPCLLVTDGLTLKDNTIDHFGVSTTPAYGIHVAVTQVFGKTCIIQNVTIENNHISVGPSDAIRLEILENDDGGAYIKYIGVSDNTITDISAGYWMSIHKKFSSSEFVGVAPSADDQTDLSSILYGDSIDDNR